MFNLDKNNTLSFIELIKAILLYPKSLFNYVSTNSYTKYYWVFLLVFAFLDTIKNILEDYSVDAHDFFILLMAIIPIKIFMAVAGQLLFLLLIFGLALAFGGAGELKEFIKLNSYSNLPLILALIINLLIYLFDTGLHFTNKQVFFVMLCIDIICALWSACLWVFSISATMKLTYAKSIVVSALSIVLLLFLHFIVFVPYAFNSVL